jgi:GMP synthase (glutamine-hydrolysing)
MTGIDSIAILDCGGQYTKVIDRRVRELSVRSEVLPINTSAKNLHGYHGIILSGGPKSVWDGDSLEYDREIFKLNIPILGICYGMHLINRHFGGVVSPGVRNEYGETDIDVSSDCPLFNGLKESQRVLMSHGDSIDKLADGFKVCASSDKIAAAVYNEKTSVYGVQFHPEVDLTVNGIMILNNFLRNVCGLSGNYILEDRITSAIEKIKKQVGDGRVLVLVSGGVDSAVTAALLLKALDNDRIYAIHVDHGLMRKDESDVICQQLEHFGLKNLIRENAADKFLDSIVEINGNKIGPLTSIIDPEEKRNLIGQVFVKVIQEVSDRLNLDPENTYWAQGTLRPDLIESGNPDVSGVAHKIKTHHNDVEMIRQARAKGMVVETNWDWHKDEVRRVARKLGIDEKIASRQPFPGPGLAIRMICHDGSHNIESGVIDKYNTALSEYGADYYGDVLPIRSVGVQGDNRSYRHLAVLWGMGLRLNWDKIYKIGTYIPNHIRGINRVAYVLNKTEVSGKIKAYKMNISRENLRLLRELDHIVTEKLNKPPMSQVLAVLVPIGIDKKYSVAIRTFITNDFMTGRPAFIGQDVENYVIASLVDEIESNFPEIDLILYDITSKPPATVEWE